MSFRRWLAVCWFTVLIVFLAVSFRSKTVSAVGSFRPVSSEELQMTKERQSPGAPAIILFRQVDRDDSGLTAHEDDYSASRS